MKKSLLFMACCISLMLMASCKKHVAPTINILEEPGYVTENAQVYAGDSIHLGFTCTGEDLTKIEIVISKDGIVLANQTGDFDNQKNDPVAPYVYRGTFVLEGTGTIDIKGTVTDAEGLTASLSFNIFCNEKPNAKFVGRYEGITLVNGTVSANISGMEPIDQTIDDGEMQVALELEAGDELDEVVGIFKFEDRDFNCKGRVNGDTVVFEAIDDVITYDYDLGNGITFSPEMNVSYNITGVLNEGELKVDGTCKGDGAINVLIYNGTIEMDTSISGTLNKID